MMMLCMNLISSRFDTVPLRLVRYIYISVGDGDGDGWDLFYEVDVR